MQLKFFTLPLHGGEAAEVLNRFLANERILAVDRHLTSDGDTSAKSLDHHRGHREHREERP